MRSSVLAEVVEPGLGVGAGLVALGLLLVAGIVLGLHLTLNMWLRPILTSLAHPKGGFFVRTALLPLTLLAKGVLSIEKKVDSLLSHWAYAHLTQLARWFSAQALVALHGAALVIDGPEKLLESLGILTHRTVPRKIHAAVVPVKSIAVGALDLGGLANQRAKNEEKSRRRAIDRLHKKWLLPLALAFAGIDAIVKGGHARAHHHDHTTTIPHTATVTTQLNARARAQARRIARLERLTTRAAIGAVAIAAITRLWPSLRCRDFGRLMRALRCSHWAFLLRLLEGAFGMFVFTEFCRVVVLVGDVAAKVLPRLVAVLATAEAALCDGRYQATKALPLNTTALGTVDNPLTF